MNIVKWIRLDIPYQQDGDKMRMTLGVKSDSGIEVYYTDYTKDIPLALEAMESILEQNNSTTDPNTVFVYPLDGRIQLAHVVLEFANKNNWQFSRHIPNEYYPDLDTKCSFEQEDTGSEQDTWDRAVVQKLIFQLNDKAKASFMSSDMPTAMSFLRHSLQLSVKHFGWTSPGVVYSLTNLFHVMKGTGNRENLKEANEVLERMLHLWDTDEKPHQRDWSNATSILADLVNVCNSIPAPKLATRLMNYQAELS